MVEKLFCIVLSFLSTIGVICTGFIPHDCPSSSGDVFFTNVSTMKGSFAKISHDGKHIQMNSVPLMHVSDSETISYEVKNTSGKNQDVSVYVKGEDNDVFSIVATPLEVVPDGSKAVGTITITLKKAVVEDVSIPFEVELMSQ